MRFLFFSAQYLPTVGGVERYTYNLCKTLIEKGHSCSVVTSALPLLPAFEVSECIEIFRLPSRLFMDGRFPVIKKNKEFKRVAAEIFNRSYDFAVINTRFYSLSLFAARQCAAQDIPSIVIEHGTKHLSVDNHILDFFGNLYEHSAMWFIRRYCDSFFGVSKACCDWLDHFGVMTDKVLYNSVDSDEILLTVGSSVFNAREKFSIKKEVSLIVFSSRLIREKGVFELLEAFDSCSEYFPDIALILAGDGPLFDKIQARNAANVFFAGRLTYSDNLALIKQADIFILPTYSEGFSSVVLEAAVLEKCIITTPTGGSPELITHKKSGILLEDASPDSIRKALIYCLDNKEFRVVAGTEIKKKVVESFSWKKTADSLIKTAMSSKKETITDI